MDETRIELQAMGPGGEIRWRFVGALDMAGADRLRSCVLPAADAGRDIELDMSETWFMDGRGLLTLLVLHRRAKERGGRLRIVASAAVMRVLRVCRVESGLDVVAAEKSAASPDVPDAVPPDWELSGAADLADALEEALLGAIGKGSARRLTAAQREFVVGHVRHALLRAGTEPAAEPAVVTAREQTLSRFEDLRAQAEVLRRRQQLAMADAADAASRLARARASRTRPLGSAGR